LFQNSRKCFRQVTFFIDISNHFCAWNQSIVDFLKKNKTCDDYYLEPFSTVFAYFISTASGMSDTFYHHTFCDNVFTQSMKNVIICVSGNMVLRDNSLLKDGK
jgi:hypothetical protein